MPRAKIDDIAREAGVSRTAVSFAFNNPSRLNQDTVARILATAQKRGYAPNPLSRALVAGRVAVLGVLVPEKMDTVFASPFFGAFLRGVGGVCDDEQLGLLTVTPLHGSLEQAIARAPVDGFIIVGLNESHHELLPLRKRNIPFVIVDGDADVAASVNIEDEEGSYAAASYLLEHGHRDVLILTFKLPYRHLDDPHYGVSGRRMRGYQRAYADYNVMWRDSWFRPSPPSIDGGEYGFATAWDEGLRPTAVLTISDGRALGVVCAAKQRGLRIPDDLEVIGYDDVPIAALASPSLSTVHQPIVEKGRMAAELLIEALDGNKEPTHIMLSTHLILRETTR